METSVSPWWADSDLRSTRAAAALFKAGQSPGGSQLTPRSQADARAGHHSRQTSNVSASALEDVYDSTSNLTPTPEAKEGAGGGGRQAGGGGGGGGGEAVTAATVMPGAGSSGADASGGEGGAGNGGVEGGSRGSGGGGGGGGDGGEERDAGGSGGGGGGDRGGGGVGAGDSPGLEGSVHGSEASQRAEAGSPTRSLPVCS